MRLIDHLKALGHNNRKARNLLRSGKIWYRGVPTADAVREVEPEHVEIRHNAPRIRTGLDPAILFSDKHLAIVWKPPGLLSTAAPRRGQDDNLITLMARRFGRAYPVHRLDEPTSGTMMVALTEPAQHALKDLLFHHHIDRQYLAIVAGIPREKTFTVSNHLVPDRGDGKRGSGSPKAPGAKAATTHFRLVQPLGPRSALVEARLETGRTHQVRIHLSEHGHPVLGDSRYANPKITRAAPRLALHAWRLALRHPMTGKDLCIETPLPDDMARLSRDLS